MVETRVGAENYLWSICLGFTGDGWQMWDNSEHNRRIIKIREALRMHVDGDRYDRHCMGRCYGKGNYGKDCFQQVSVDERRCYLHR